MTREEAISEWIIPAIKNTWNEKKCKEILEALKPKTGHWKLKRTFPTKIYDEYLNEYKCSKCYREIRCTEGQLVNYPYCHCGVKMEGEENNEK